MKFLCGCSLNPDGDEKHDAEGFVICSTHAVRRQGWRMPSHSPKLPAGIHGATDLEYEQWVLYGKRPEREQIPVVITVQDRRDNRDPEEIGQEILSRRNGNGHVPNPEKEFAYCFHCSKPIRVKKDGTLYGHLNGASQHCIGSARRPATTFMA